MKIRKMTPNDIPTVVAIESETYSEPISESDLHKEIKNKNNGSEHPSLAPIVATEDDEVIGYALFDRDHRNSKSLILLVVATAKSKGRQGVAAKLIEYIKGKMKALKCSGISTALVHQDRLPAQNFLSKMGFTCTEIEGSEFNGEECESYRFNYSVPLDDLSSRHIAKIAKECKEARLSNQQDEE